MSIYLYVFPANKRATTNAEDVSYSMPTSHHDTMLHLSNSHIDTMTSKRKDLVTEKESLVRRRIQCMIRFIFKVVVVVVVLTRFRKDKPFHACSEMTANNTQDHEH